MRAADDVDRGAHLGHGAVGRLGDIDRRSRQPPERVGSIAGMLFDTGHHLGMGRLHEQGPNPTDERGGVTDDPPRHRVGTEQSRVPRVVERVLQGLGAVREERGRGLDDPILQGSDHRHLLHAHGPGRTTVDRVPHRSHRAAEASWTSTQPSKPPATPGNEPTPHIPDSGWEPRWSPTGTRSSPARSSRTSRWVWPCVRNGSALFASVAAGERPTALVLVSPRTDSAVTFPCGACLQVGLELGGPDLLVVAATVEGPVEQHRLADLLPRGPHKS